MCATSSGRWSCRRSAAGDQAVAAYTTSSRRSRCCSPTGGWRTWRRSSATRSASSPRASAPISSRSARVRWPGHRSTYDRAALATRLGFSRLADNSLDAVGDRDFALEYLNAAAALAIHLSRLAEDLVLWCSPGFGWFGAPGRVLDRIEPAAAEEEPRPVRAGARQERAPDRQRRAARDRAQGPAVRVPEGSPGGQGGGVRHRRHAGRHCSACAAGGDHRAARAAREDGRLAHATTCSRSELADALVAEGVPFREAHAAVGRLWAAAERAGVTPAALPEAERLALSPLLHQLAAHRTRRGLRRSRVATTCPARVPGRWPCSWPATKRGSAWARRSSLAHPVPVTARTPAGAAPAGPAPIPAARSGAPISRCWPTAR